MGKVINISPEEREQAIATINKLGEAVTEDKINYYVQLRRNTISYQNRKEYDSAPAPIESVKKIKPIANIAIWASIIAIVMCFVISGFGFSIWWYIVIVGLILLVLSLMGTISITMKQSDLGFVKKMSIACFICIGFLWTCGPLNSNYERSDRSDSYENDVIETRTWKCEKCGYVGTNYYNKETKLITGEMPKVAYGKHVCASCYGDYERWKPAVDAARKKFGGGY